MFEESYQRFSLESQECLETFTRKLIEDRQFISGISDAFYQNFLLQKDEVLMQNHKRNGNKVLNI